MSKTQKIIALGSAYLTVLAIAPGSVFAQSNSFDITQNVDARFQPLANISPFDMLRVLVNFLLGIAGVAAFIFLLWGGLQWILAGGDKEGTEKARKKITNALIGLAIVFSAYALLFIIKTLFGINVFSVNIGKISP